ncbi:ABC transporter ATP-binding protein [Candidatus Kaiserbacteria bacterium]|nr:ABC transporter ATP-binding protein [Candidatus Kaiserbacteria bacterium]
MEPTHKKMASAGSVFRIYGNEVLRQPFTLFLIISGAIGAQVGSLVIPIYMRQLLNTLASGDRGPLVVHSLSITIGVIGIVMLLRWVFSRIEMWSLSFLEIRIMSNLTLSSFEYLIRHSHHFFASQFAGTLTRRVNQYARAFELAFDSIIMSFFPAAFFVVGAIVVLFAHNHVLGAMLGFWSILFVIVQVYLSRMHRPLRVSRAELESKLGGAIADAIGNHNAIMLSSGVGYEHERLGQFTDNLRAARLKGWHFYEYALGIQGFLMIVINVALLYGAMYFWQHGELTIGDFILIQTYLVGTFEMLHNVSIQLRRFYDSIADAEEMVALLEEPHQIQDVPNAPPLTVSNGAIDFKDITFRFQEERSILEHLDLSIRPGEKVALVGPSGAGKSTITKLLLRMYDVTEGAILIDGQNIAQVTQDSLRDSIGFVPQEPVLFHRSLMENIRYGKRDATDEEVIEAAKKAHCHEFIQGLAQGYDTFVGERGVKLSGGERQRVAIARAILKNAPILVLDEATSSLDSESESLIQDSLKILMQGKTVLVIAHRLSTIMSMDRIVVLQGGHVVAQGAHDKLIKEGGLYQKLWSIQAGGFIQEEEE